MSTVAAGAVFSPGRSQTVVGAHTAMLLASLYIASFIFEGPIRFALSKGGIEGALYFRDLVPVICVLCAAYAWADNRAKPATLLIFCYLLALHFFIGMFSTRNLFQQLFGLKLFLPMLLGMAIASIDEKGALLARYLKIVTVIFAFSLAGVFINYFITFPWEGGLYDTVFGGGQQARDWTAGGVRRLGGFSRSSFDAASVLLICVSILWFQHRSILSRFLVWVLAGVAIYLTTSKGALLALCVFAATAIVSSGGKKRKLLLLVVSLTFLAITLLPSASLMLDVHRRALPDFLFWWLSSFVERMEVTWPNAFALVSSPTYVLFGKGIGGIGLAQRYGDWWQMNPADNLVVYLAITFGLLGFFYFIVFFLRLLWWPERRQPVIFLVLGTVLVVATYGLTLNVIEQPVLSCALGYCIAHVCDATRRIR